MDHFYQFKPLEMKKFLPFVILFIGSIQANAQSILNEVYAFPGGARNEFYEFYNNSNSSTNMDNYTLVSFFEEGTTKGFFVIDLPNLTVVPRGYFVGSSAIPFNYQGVTNSTMSQYSWNDLAFMSANNAYLRKWVMGTSVSAIIDGNEYYDMAPVPAGFNDVFQKIGGTGATYNVFVYRNGVLMSIFLGGTGGATFLPNYIVGLPSLKVNMTATAPDFTIDFSTYATARTEFVIQDIGSDNGYIRLRDGYCGAWTKSSSSVTHTPGVTNGGEAPLEPAVSVAAVIVKGTALTGSTVTYDVVGADAIEFPITMYVYVDNGTVPGELDANDTYLTSSTEYSISDGAFSSVFFPYTANIVIQTMTSAGCIDHERMIPNAGVLPVRFTSYQAVRSGNNYELKWTVADNESGKQFIIEKSTDGKNFTIAGNIYATQSTGNEQYRFTDAANLSKAFYRVKLVTITNAISYSGTLLLENRSAGIRPLTVNQNPVDAYLNFGYQSDENTLGTISIYNGSGVKVYSQQTNLAKDMNSITINLDGKIYRGLYILEVKTSMNHNTVKFIKR
jgi:hypothetical protein